MQRRYFHLRLKQVVTIFVLCSVLSATRAATIDYPPRKTYPDENYPQYRSLLEIVEQWPPDNPDVPNEFHETIQMFNYSNLEERQMALAFRQAEVPFKLYDIPEIEKVVNLWTDDYLINRMANDPTINVEKSVNNHFMFWKRKPGMGSDFKEPTSFDRNMGFEKWLTKAHEADRNKLESESEHLYFHKNQKQSHSLRGKRSTFIGKDLTLFTQTENNFFVFNVEKNKGIQCRFGMRGIIAASHYDAGRNMIAMLKGSKRYIINPPEACPQLGVLSEASHPSYRHSIYDWSDVEFAKKYFHKVPAIDTIVQTGEILYVPSFWFHYIISLEYSIQCNSRSGTPNIGKEEVLQCFKEHPVLSYE